MDFAIKSWMYLVLPLFYCHSHAQNQTPSKEEVLTALDRGIQFFHSLNIEGGYVYHYTLDLSEKWGEGKTDDHTIEVQPPGTPAVGMSFLKAYQTTKNPAHLEAARDAASALIKGQNRLGGWEHKIHFNRPMGRRVSFDDDQTQSAIRFLMALDQEVDDHALTKAIEAALQMMLDAQLDHGGWPHMYPKQDNYHDFATFNDGGINDCIQVMLMAHQLYRRPDCKMSLEKAGRFMLISQLPPPQPGWAQQYNDYLQPAWARSFEPPSVCPAASIKNLQTLMDLYAYLGERAYLEAIPDCLRWLEESQLPNGLWGRFLELGTNKPLYYDRGRIRVNSMEELSLERRTGYGYENDLTRSLQDAKQRFEQLGNLSMKKFPIYPDPTSYRNQDRVKVLIPEVTEILATQDDQGRWIVKNDRFRRIIPGEPWDGTYREEDRISSALFNRNIDILCEYLSMLGN